MSKKKGKVVPLDSLIRQDLEPQLYQLFMKQFPGFAPLERRCLTPGCMVFVDRISDPYYCVVCRRLRAK